MNDNIYTADPDSVLERTADNICLSLPVEPTKVSTGKSRRKERNVNKDKKIIEVSNETSCAAETDGTSVVDNLPAGSVSEHILIPSEAIGGIIGTKGVHMAMLNQILGIVRVKLEKCGPNQQVLTIIGSRKAVDEVSNLTQKKINLSQHYLSNRSRAVHSWAPSKTGQILTPREVHKTGGPAPKVGSAKYEREQSRVREAAIDFERGGESVGAQKKKKISTKVQKDVDAEFELARQQFEAVKLAREAAKKK